MSLDCHIRRIISKPALAAAVFAASSAICGASWAQSFAPNPESQLSAITSWWDTSRNTQFVVYVSQYDEIVVLTCGDGGCWQVAATDPVPGVEPGGLYGTNPLLPFAGGSPLTGYFDGTTGHLFFVGWELNQHTFDYQHVGDLWEEHIDSSGTWSGQSLTAATNATQPWNGKGTGYRPYLVSSLSSLFAQDRQHVFYIGADFSQVHDTYFDGAWHDVTISGSIDPPFMGLNLTSYFDGLEHVYAAGQEVYSSCDECNWLPGTAPSLGGGYVFGETHSGVESIFGMASPGVLRNAYFVGGWYQSDSWADNYNQNSPLLSYEDNSNISPRAFYVGGDQHIYQQWNDEDITAEIGAPLAAMGSDDDALSPITGYYDGINDHVFYIGADQHVHELYMSSTTLSGGWLQNDLTLSANATQTDQLPNLP